MSSHVVGRNFNESYLEEKSLQEVHFLSWDKSVQFASKPIESDESTSEAYVLVIDEIIRSPVMFWSD